MRFHCFLNRLSDIWLARCITDTLCFSVDSLSKHTRHTYNAYVCAFRILCELTCVCASMIRMRVAIERADVDSLCLHTFSLWIKNRICTHMHAISANKCYIVCVRTPSSLFPRLIRLIISRNTLSRIALRMHFILLQVFPVYLSQEWPI